MELSLKEWILVGYAILSTIMSIITAIAAGNKKSNLITQIKERLTEWLPVAINIAEASGTSGSNKKFEVVQSGLKYAEKLYGRKLTNDECVYFTSFLGNQTESILSTPQKKEDN